MIEMLFVPVNLHFLEYEDIETPHSVHPAIGCNRMGLSIGQASWCLVLATCIILNIGGSLRGKDSGIEKSKSSKM